jgi:(S)-mandelate dehydrogenase
VSALDVLPRAREIAGDRIALHVSGGLRRGTDLLKALCLGADAVWAGRAPRYGLCAAGSAGASKALNMITNEASDAMALSGATNISELGKRLLTRVGG